MQWILLSYLKSIFLSRLHIGFQYKQSYVIKLGKLFRKIFIRNEISFNHGELSLTRLVFVENVNLLFHDLVKTLLYIDF